MIKHDLDIEKDVFVGTNAYFAGKISGGVYREGYRPIDSEKEDAVVTVSFGTAGQIQEAGVYVNVYVADKKNGAQNIPNKERMSAISNMTDALMSALNAKYAGEYYFELGRTTKVYREEEIGQHRVSMNFSIKRQTF